MPRRNRDLHGYAPDSCAVALLLIDVINTMSFPEGRQLHRHALPAARAIADLKRRCLELGIPSIYAHDNFGRWRSDRTSLVTHCQATSRGAPLVRLLKPHRRDYFVIKPKHSGFYSTSLDLLLRYLDVETLIIVGFAGNICVLYTANDAYMRDYTLVIPRDCCAANRPQDNRAALRHMQTTLKADIAPSASLDLQGLLKRRDADQHQTRRVAQ